MRRFASACLAGVLALAAVACGAQNLQPLKLDAQTESVEVLTQGSRLEDLKGRLSPQDVAAAFDRGEMTPVTTSSVRDFGVRDERRVWFRFEVASDAPADWVLEVGRPELRRVALFVRSQDGSWNDEGELGDELPYSARPIPHRSFLFRVHLAAGRTPMLLRVKSEGPVDVRATLWEPHALQLRDASFNSFAWLFYGVLGAMLAYNLILYVMVRDRGYLYYVCSIGGSIPGFMAQTGLFMQYAGDAGMWWWGRLLAVGWSVSSIFRILLTRHFMLTRQRAPRIDAVMVFFALACTATLVSSLVFPRYVAGPMLIFSGVGSSIFLDVVAIVALARRWPGAIYFFASWMVLSLGVVVGTARFFTLLPSNVVTTNFLAISAAVSYVLLSIALANQINEEKRQREHAQAHTLAIMRASQALGSESRLDRLHARLREIMAALTGATHVHLALWDPDHKQWFLQEGDASTRVALDEAGREKVLPVSVVQHVADLQEPLLVPDVAADDRFAADPSFEETKHTSLLALPIDQHGAERAVLLLENRGSTRAFSPTDIETLASIAGPLAVSVENILLYERLEQRVAEQTRELREAQQQLVGMARRAGMAEIATNVLHNMGNILNSVNVEADLLRSRLHEAKFIGVSRAGELLESHAGDIAAFVSSEKGRVLPGYLRELGKALEHERDEMLERLGRLLASVEHIKNVVATQQAFAGSSVFTERLAPAEIVDDALRMTGDSLQRHGIEVVKEVEDLPPMLLDKTRALQILVNLINNARQALDTAPDAARSLHVRMDSGDGMLRFRVKDEGCGIAKENLARIFSHGFTTRSGGHGFGLHSCALAAGEMGGRLTAHSDGVGRGATFTLEIPLKRA